MISAKIETYSKIIKPTKNNFHSPKVDLILTTDNYKGATTEEINALDDLNTELKIGWDATEIQSSPCTLRGVSCDSQGHIFEM